MKTITVNISEASIREFAKNPEVRELNDPRTPLRFRYLSDRTKGSWFYSSSKIPYHWLGRHPMVKPSLIKSMLPQIEINLASGMETQAAMVGHFVTVSDLLKWHLRMTMNKRAIDQTRKQGIKTAINRYLLPRVGDIQMVDVTRPVMLNQFFMPMQKQYAISTIKLALAVLKTAFKYAHGARLIDINPVAEFRVSEFLPEKPKPKASVLEARHLPDILNSVFQVKHSYATVMVGIMILHGTRIGETRLARWDQFDFIDNTWTIPASITKGGSPELKLMLTRTSVELLKKHQQWQRKRGYSGVWLFKGSARSAMTPTQANNAIQGFSDREWTAHHIRKAYRDLLTEVGTDFLIAERMINHSLTTLVKTYNQKEHLEKARAANEKAHQWILDRIAASNPSLTHRSSGDLHV